MTPVRLWVATHPIGLSTESKLLFANRQNSLSLKHLAVLTLHCVKTLYKSPINDSLQPIPRPPQ